jgi:hypothetical protein
VVKCKVWEKVDEQRRIRCNDPLEADNLDGGYDECRSDASAAISDHSDSQRLGSVRGDVRYLFFWSGRIQFAGIFQARHNADGLFGFERSGQCNHHWMHFLLAELEKQYF